MVADGMGGAAAGEIASSMCAEAFAESRPDPACAATTRCATPSGRQRRDPRARGSDPESAGMGTTAIAALVEPNGPGRVRTRRRQPRLPVARRRASPPHRGPLGGGRAGGRRPAVRGEASSHPQRNVITRVLGAEPTVQVDTFVRWTAEADIGAALQRRPHRRWWPSRIAELLAGDQRCEQRARTWCGRRSTRGGEDNVTAIVFRLDQVDDDRTGQIRTDPDDRPRPGCPDDGGRRHGRRALFMGLGVVGAVVLLHGRRRRRPAREPLHRRGRGLGPRRDLPGRAVGARLRHQALPPGRGNPDLVRVARTRDPQAAVRSPPAAPSSAKEAVSRIEAGNP